MITVPRSIIFRIALAALLGGCSGGGGGGPAPVPTAGNPYGGQGTTPQFDQKVNFSVVVPPPAALLAARARRKTSAVGRRHGAATTSATNPYVSPNVASVSIVIGSVDGLAVSNPPATTVANVACTGTTGCSVPIQGVAAAKGADLFIVETFSGPKASGNLVSSSTVAVTVPSAAATSFGGTALTVGGLVQSVSLVADIPGQTFFYDTIGSGSLAVNALDSAGAVIIGDTILQDAISLTFPSQDNGDFSFGGAGSTTLSGPARVAFDYNGNAINGPFVTASTLDFGGNPISASLTIPVAPAPTMEPSAPPTTSAQSLFVFDGQGDRIVEYSGISRLEGGGSVTARRAFDVAPPPGASFTCAFGPNQPIAAGFAVGPDGTIYVQTTCVDATGAIGYVFAYGATAADTVSPSGVATPPTPVVIPIDTGTGAYTPEGIKLDPTTNQLLASYYGSQLGTPQIVGVSLTAPYAQTVNVGANCIGVIATAAPCDPLAVPQTVYGAAPIPFDFALDGRGSVLLVAQNPANPPEPASEAFATQTAIVAVPERTNGSPVATGALSGYTTELGGQDGVALATDATDLYALVNAGGAPIAQPITGDSVFAGLSACPPPSANAPTDLPNVLCASGFTAYYLAVYRDLLPTFATSGTSGRDLSKKPDLMLGGDGVGMFGSANPAIAGDYLAVSAGYVFIVNDSPNSGNSPPAVQVYNTNGIAGFRTNVLPFQTISFAKRLPNDAGYAIVPSSIAIAPTGTSTDGTGLLSRRPRVHHDLEAYARLSQSRRASRLHRR